MPSEKISSDPTKFEETPKTDDQDYEKPLGARESNSVYDFIYQDVRRVGSFLAQFEEYGVRQSVKATESVGNTQTIKGSATGTIGLPAIMGGSANLDSTTADETKDIAEHVFDPLWSNSRRLLNYLEDHGLIYRNVDDARLGQFILVNGSISILDSAILDHAFNDAQLFEALYLQACKEGGVDSASDVGLELKRNLIMISKLPKSIQLFFYDFPRRFWATVTTESLVTSAHDISAKHGAILSGSWNMLGILDAWPDFRGIPSDEDPDPKTLDELGVSVLDDGFLKVAANFINLVRNTLGRPRSHFGVTPLLIFRTVSGPDEN